MVGPTANTNSISATASTMLRMDRFLTPLSRPASTEISASAVITAIAITCTVVPTGIDGHR